jgi:mono/diheme cytochrome c family protein
VNQNVAPAPPTPTSAPSTPAPLAGADLAQATELFDGKCATCHLESGKGDPHHKKDDIPDFTDASWQAKATDAEPRDAITNGRGKVMPAFKGSLTGVTKTELRESSDACSRTT